MGVIIRMVAAYVPQWLKATGKKLVWLLIIGIPLVMFLDGHPEYAPVMKIVGVVIYAVMFVIVAAGLGIGLYAAVKSRSVGQFLYTLVLGALVAAYLVYRLCRTFQQACPTVTGWFQ